MTTRIIDTHSHTNRSDGKNFISEREKQIQSHIELYGSDILAIITDHDDVSQRLSGDGFHTAMGTEASSYSKKLNRYAHLCMYANVFQEAVGEVLHTIQKTKKSNLEKNIGVLTSLGFPFDSADFFNYFLKNAENDSNLNNFQLSEFIMTSPENRAHANRLYKEITHKDVEFKNSLESIVFFLKTFLKESGECSDYGLAKNRGTVGVEPELISQLAADSDGIVSLAHPHVTFKKGIQQFLEYFDTYYHDFGVRAIEIPTTANQERTTAIIHIAQQYNCLITFGSDSHGYEPDASHGAFLSMNPNVDKKIVQYHSDAFIERFCSPVELKIASQK